MDSALAVVVLLAVKTMARGNPIDPPFLTCPHELSDLIEGDMPMKKTDIPHHRSSADAYVNRLVRFRAELAFRELETGVSSG